MINWFITCRKLKVITFLCLPDRNVQTSVSEFVQVPCKTLYGVAILHCLEVFIYSVIEGGFYIFQVGCPVVWTEVAENNEENNFHFCAAKKDILFQFS